MDTQGEEETVETIAVVGMAGRFPGAKDVDAFWRNLRDGVESIAVFTDEELAASGIDADALNSPAYVKARGIVDDVELFDASFFEVSQREAELMDPQFRFFLESSWEALENAGYDPERYEGVIGIYGGMSMSQYLIHNLLPNRDVFRRAGALQLRILNDKDFLTPFVAYKLNLRGPTVNVQTACSTSLVAAHLASHSLLSYQCDVALAGGVSLPVSRKSGYISQEGVYSGDGHCRAFDADAQGTVSGSGVGVVVLKRLSDALNDGDHIYAVLKGSAINNDGALKVSYTAPSVDGQAEVIAMAQAVAGVEPETVTYIEAHGTGTPMGDPIEVAALTQVFGAGAKKNFCALGSVKTNVGHSDAAAGVTSLIKTVLALKHGLLPPSLNFRRPNPEIDFANSPFYVNDRLARWEPEGIPRRAGVSSFAIGGVNAHIVLEEAPTPTAPAPSRPWQLVTLSAQTEHALEAATDNLTAYMEQNEELNLADVAYTLQIGRRAFNRRRVVVCRDRDDLVKTLKARNQKRMLSSARNPVARPVAFMFPGLGNHYVDMGWELYRHERVFREHVNRCCEMLKPHLETDLRDVMYPSWKQPSEAPEIQAVGSRLDLRRMLRGEAQAQAQEEEDETARVFMQTVFSQPALFVVEYALAQLWKHWGIEPGALIGYSIGEYVAACLGGVYSLEDALMLVARRARLIQQLPEGAMLAVPASPSELEPFLNEKLCLSAINGPSVCVVSGTTGAVEQLQQELARQELSARRLQTNHAFHSPLMNPIVEDFAALVRTVELIPPRIPVISNVTGDWLTAEQATDPNYWATHLSLPVLFGDGIQELWKKEDTVLLEVGPGQALGAWALQHPESEKAQDRLVLASLRHSYDQQNDQAFILNTLGRLWLAGVEANWSRFYNDERRARVPLPTYPFERKRYWMDAKPGALDDGDNIAAETAAAKSAPRRKEMGDWFYLPSWRQAEPLAEPGTRTTAESAEHVRRSLIFIDDSGVGLGLAQRLRRVGHEVLTVAVGERFDKSDAATFIVNPMRAEDYEALIKQLRDADKLPQAIFHLWNVTREPGAAIDPQTVEKQQQRGFYSLLFLAQALGNHAQTGAIQLLVITDGMQSVSGEERLCPAKATVLGPCQVIHQEYPHITCRSIDIKAAAAGTRQEQQLLDQLMAELFSQSGDALIAYRGSHRWLQTFEPFALKKEAGKGLLREGGVYLITGGIGGIGLTLAAFLAREARAKLILTGRSSLPEREEWDEWVARHDSGEPTARKIKQVQAIEATGAEVLLLRADVTSREEMEKALAATHKRFGRINGIVHAAGVSPGGMMQVKAVETAASVLAPKVQGTLVLDAVCKDEPLDFFVLCSSLNAILGGFGLVDHCAANAFLDAFAEERARRDSAYTLSVNWDAWLEVGQAANASLSAGLHGLLRSSSPSARIDHPLLDELTLDESEHQVFTVELSPQRHWVLDEHRVTGLAMLPGTAYLEMVRAAFEPRAGNRNIRLEKVFFKAPLIVQDRDSKETLLSFSKNGDAFDFSVRSRSVRPGGNVEEWQEHLTGRLSLVENRSTTHHPLAQLIERLCPQAVGKEDAGQGRDQNSSELAGGDSTRTPLQLGERWKKLSRRVGLGTGEGLAVLELPEEFAEDLRSYKLHPSLLDAATGFIQLAREGAYLPLAYESIEIKAPLSRKLYSYARLKGDGAANNEVLACDLTIMDELGTELVEIKDYTLRRVRGTDALGLASDHGSDMAAGEQRAAQPGEARRGQTGMVKATPPKPERGVSPEEGAEVFARLLGNVKRAPRVAVSTTDFTMLLQQSRALTGTRILEEVDTLRSSRQRRSRPSLHVAYTAPRNDLEKSLADIWQEVLGLDGIGIYDSFFDLGGDSLLATLLIGRLEAAFDRDFALRTLFDSPSVAEMALIIVSQEAAEIKPDELAELLNRIRHRSEDEAKAMLTRDEQSRSQT
ncbi:MAG TPA: SDR family oxidoreductase [Pyrinomonadaceae bacterium]|jgi:acyl transferase domain-containing protein/acyl carrier protein|nr:SDR family oxidoreductase [Pyrinomonadaceae bacterium]